MDAVSHREPHTRPEDSVALRVAIMCAVMTGVVALAAEQVISMGTAGVVLAILPVAYWISYRRRAKDNWPIKLGLTVGAVIALIRFLGQVQGVTSLDQVRFPLADISCGCRSSTASNATRKDSTSVGSSPRSGGRRSCTSPPLRVVPRPPTCFVRRRSRSARSELQDGTQGWMHPPPCPIPRPGGRSCRCPATALAGAILFLVGLSRDGLSSRSVRLGSV